MEAFKIAFFEQEHACFFPAYRSLPLAGGRLLQARIATRFRLTVAGTAGEFACALQSRQTYYLEANAEQENFALLPTLAALGIAPLPELFINWAHFEKVDAFQTADVARYFDDLWYHGPDDIDLFDASVNWAVSIRHDGVVSFIH